MNIPEKSRYPLAGNTKKRTIKSSHILSIFLWKVCDNPFSKKTEEKFWEKKCKREIFASSVSENKIFAIEKSKPRSKVIVL